MGKSVHDMTNEEILNLSEDEAKEVLQETMSEYKHHFEKTIEYLINKPGFADIPEDTVHSVNTATNMLVYGDRRDMLAGMLAVAQREVAMYRLEKAAMYETGHSAGLSDEDLKEVGLCPPAHSE